MSSPRGLPASAYPCPAAPLSHGCVQRLQVWVTCVPCFFPGRLETLATPPGPAPSLGLHGEGLQLDLANFPGGFGIAGLFLLGRALGFHRHKNQPVGHLVTPRGFLPALLLDLTYCGGPGTPLLGPGPAS